MEKMEFSMKNLFKFLGIIALAAVFGLFVVSCSNGSTGGTPSAKYTVISSETYSQMLTSVFTNTTAPTQAEPVTLVVTSNRGTLITMVKGGTGRTEESGLSYSAVEAKVVDIAGQGAMKDSILNELKSKNYVGCAKCIYPDVDLSSIVVFAIYKE